MRLMDIRTGATGRVVVLADGYRTNEYEVENRDGNLQCWIAAESDKKVSVQWDFMAEHEFYQVDLFVDGIFQDTCSGRSEFPADSLEVLHNLIDEGTSIASKGTMYRHQMFFKELSRRSGGEANTRSAMGTIELRIFHEIGDKLVSPRPCDQFASYEDMLEDVFTNGGADLKSPTHGIMYDNPFLYSLPARADTAWYRTRYKNGTRVLRGNSKRKDAEAFQQRPGLGPWATFKFFYRSKGMFACGPLSLEDTELHKAALKDIGVTFLPNPDDFVIRFRSRAPPPVALGSPIIFKNSTSLKKSQSAEIPSQHSQDPGPAMPADTVAGSVVDSSRDPRLQSRNTLRVGPPADVGKVQPQLPSSKCSQESPEEAQVQGVEQDGQRSQRVQGGDRVQEVGTAAQAVEVGGGENAPKCEEEVDAEAAGGTGGESHGESMSEGSDSEGSEGDNHGTIQDRGLEKAGTTSQLAPTPAETAKLTPCGSRGTPQPKASTYQSIFGAPSIINRSKSPWVPTSASPPIPEAPLPIRSAPPEAQLPPDNSTSNTPQKVTTPAAAKTSHGPEGSDDLHWGPSTGCLPLENDDSISTPSTHKRKRSASLSENGGEGFNQDTPEMKRRRDNISSLKLELVKNIREKEEKMVSAASPKILLSSNPSSNCFSQQKLEAALLRKNQRITNDVSRLNQELEDLDADDLDKVIG